MSDNSSPLAVIAIRQVAKSTGASRVALSQAAVLVGLGYRVIIIAERGQPELVTRNGARLVRTYRWPFKGPFRRFWFNRRVQAWVRRHHPDLLVSHGDVETPDVIYLHNCVHLASQAIHGRALPDNHEVAAIHDYILRGKRFRRVAVNSKMMGHELASRYGINAEQIDINYPGYDPQQFNPDAASIHREELRNALGVGKDGFLIGLVTSGNFKKRNVEGFVRIAAELNRLLPDRCRFLVVGKDDAKPWQRLAEDLGIAEQFIWRSTVPEVERLYGALDLFVFPAHIEEFGLVALEAMACATPVLLSSGVGCAELLESSHPELILESGDIRGWVERAKELLEAPVRRAELGMQLSTLAQQYSHECQQKKLIGAFKTLGPASR